VNWYNTEHLHSGIKLASPADRHNGNDILILANRHRIYQQARLSNPERWTKKMKLSKEEKELLKSVEDGEWETISDFKSEQKRYQAIAKNSLKKMRGLISGWQQKT